MKKILNIILVVLLAYDLSAQSLFFEKYTTENGLPLNPVYSVLQDSKGYVWIGTEGGVAKFDGHTMITYVKSDGLPAPHVNHLFEDSHGNIWISTIEGLAKFNGNSFKSYTKEDGLPDDYINMVAEDIMGGIWIAVGRKGVVWYYNNKFKHFDSQNGFPGKKVWDIEKDTDGNLWFATEGQGVFKRDENGFTQFTRKDGLPSDSVYSIKMNYKNEIIFGTNKGLSIYNGTSFKNYGKRFGIKNAVIKDIVEDKYRDLWICYDGEGIAQFDGSGVTNYREESGLPSNTVMVGMEDLRGDLWFGTQNGLIRIKAERVRSVTDINGLLGNVVYAIGQNAQNDYLFGSYNFGLNILHKDKFSYLTVKDGLPSNNISCTFLASDGRIWLGTDNGICVWDGNKIKTYNVDDGLVGNIIFDIGEDRDGNLWFGGQNGVSVFDGKKMTSYTVKDGIAPEWVYCLYIDSEGKVWLGSDVGGATVWDGNKFIIYGSDQGLPKGAVMDILEDRFGNYWFAMEGGGIVRYDGENFKPFTSKDGLSSDICYTIIEEGKYLFVGTGNGIDRIDYTALETEGAEAIRIFSEADGLPSAETTMGGSYIDDKGSLWFGTQGGVVNFNPRNKPNTFAPPIYFTSIQCSNAKLNLDSVATLPEVNLDYEQNNISFSYTAISFDSPEKIAFAYKLIGLKDTTWQETRESHISYPFLPAGEYRFIIKARNGDNIWSEKAAELHFIISPPFYATWWFYSLTAVSIILIAYLFYVMKTEQVKKRNIELANLVRMRTKELEEEKNKSDELLMNILPESAVNELKDNGLVQPRDFKNVSILFTDFKGFTWTASILPPDKLVNELNDIFGSFDKIMIKYGLEKLKTIGDAYMAACGLPIEREDHAIRVIEAATAMQEYIEKRNEDSAIKWEMRLGIHSGQVVAGVVGVKKFTYDIWGDTVNIAARMESSGEPGKINISAFTYMLVRDYYECEYRGKVEAKGKGKIDMYFVLGRKDSMKNKIDEILNLPEYLTD